ncbi:MAG: ABC transporter permease [Hyphomicrobiales bacterium]|nr:ABC transporter permease [Hyphomicrobiales bacterium]
MTVLARFIDMSFIGVALSNRRLLWRLTRRDIEGRFRGTRLGVFWAMAAPLVILSFYTFAFSIIIQPRWQAEVELRSDVALIYFSGLVLFDFFIECLNRAPTLMRENQFYIKKMVFPVEVFAYVVLLASSFRLVIGLALLLLVFAVTHGALPAGLLLLPVPILFLALFAIGIVWAVSAFSVYVRDIGPLLLAISPVLMFASPVFYPARLIPEPWHTVYMINPLALPIEWLRAVLFGNDLPGAGISLLYAAGAIVVAHGGYRLFRRLRVEFADVL